MNFFNHQILVIWVRNPWSEQGAQQCHRVRLWLCFTVWSEMLPCACGRGGRGDNFLKSVFLTVKELKGTPCPHYLLHVITAHFGVVFEGPLTSLSKSKEATSILLTAKWNLNRCCKISFHLWRTLYCSCLVCKGAQMLQLKPEPAASGEIIFTQCAV